MPTKEDLIKAEQLGIKIKKGPYSAEECAVIKEVFDHFAHIHMVTREIEINEANYNDFMVHTLGFFRSGTGGNIFITKILVNIGKRLRDRTLLSLHSKSRDLMSPLLLPSELSSDQQLEVVNYMINNPNLTPSQIALRFNISPRTVNILKLNKVTKKRTIVNHGPWTPEEDAKLMKTVLEVINSDKVEDALRKHIEWGGVSLRMGTRSLTQCQRRFMSHLQWKIGVVDIIHEGDIGTRLKDAAKILYFIHMSIWYNRVRGSYSDIDWDKLVEMLPHLDLRTIMATFDQLLESVPKELKTRRFRKQVRWLFDSKLRTLMDVNGDNFELLENFWLSCLE